MPFAVDMALLLTAVVSARRTGQAGRCPCWLPCRGATHWARQLVRFGLPPPCPPPATCPWRRAPCSSCAGRDNSCRSCTCPWQRNDKAASLCLKQVSPLLSHLPVFVVAVFVVESLYLHQGHSACRVCICICLRTCISRSLQRIHRSPWLQPAPSEKSRDQEEAVVQRVFWLQLLVTPSVRAARTLPSLLLAKPSQAA